MAWSVAERGDVLETGHLALQGQPGEPWANDEVRAAYRGAQVAKTG